MKFKCSHCKNLFNIENLMITASSIKKGKLYSYYSCRPCKTRIMKEYRSTPNGKVIARKATINTIFKYPEKTKARNMLQFQITKNKITRPEICSICNNKKKVDAHHSDYTKPLDVIWVCRQCHADIHKKL